MIRWETMAFLCINKLIGEDNREFYRSQLMSADMLNFAVKLTGALGHKENPQKPEETLQRTIQNMRDKKYITFLERGKYRLTMEGYNEMLKTVKEFQDSINNLIKAKQKTS